MPKKNNTRFKHNLKNSEILTAAKRLPDKKAKNGSGRAAEIAAKRLGTSASTMYQAKAVLKNASEKDLRNLNDNKTSIKKIYSAYNESKQITVSPLKKAVDILEKNKFRVLKIEEDFNNSLAYKGIINVQIVPKEL